MFDWNLHEDESEVMSELCEGIGKLSRDNVVSLLAGVMYAVGIDFSEVKKRIENDDGTELDFSAYVS